MSGLAGKLLIASPTLKDPNFERTVVLLCHHDQQGGMGLIINRPRPMTMIEMFNELNMQQSVAENQRNILSRRQVHEGGPVDPIRGFILHDTTRSYEATLRVHADIHLTASRDVLEAIAQGNGPDHYLIMLGYAGWGAGQLEEELLRNDWLLASPSPQLLFETPATQQWLQALRTQGIDPACLSMQPGHA